MRFLSRLASLTLPGVVCIFMGLGDDLPQNPHEPGSAPKARRQGTELTDQDRQFWSFKPLKNSTPPATGSSWPRNAIDHFILAKLAAKGIAPNAPASWRTLIRRVYFDLIGLPPRPDQIDSFLQSPDPQAYDKLLDTLLANSHYGERWARHWLDVARFAESHGFEHDYDRPYAYHYRDFVIQAFNRDMPYNQFLQWQLAGDEFAPEEPLALMATGFLGAGVFPTQITANEVERTRYDALDDMSSTMGTAMLGLTIGCARCHDHKFDPIPALDYYRLLSSFTTTVRSEIELDLNPKIYKEAKARFDAEHAPLASALENYERSELPGKFARWLDAKPSQPTNATWIIADSAAIDSEKGTEFKKLDDGSFLATGKSPSSDTYTIRMKTKSSSVTALRLEALADDSLPKKGPGRAENGNFALSSIRVTTGPSNSLASVKLENPIADFQQNSNSLSIASSLDNDRKTGWAVDGQIGKSHSAVFHFAESVGGSGGAEFTITLEFGVNVGHSIGRLRVAFASETTPVRWDRNSTLQTLQDSFEELARENLSEESRRALLGYFKSQDQEWISLKERVDAHLKTEPKPKLTKVQICSEGKNIKPMRHHTQGADFFNETYYLSRGDTEQKKGVVTQGFLQVLMRSRDDEKRWQVNPPEGSATSYRRRSLANWITDSDSGAGHLAARVMVNRLWQHHFGRGIVGTPNDFGTQGQRPTHPELLDWLSLEFIKSGWSVKHIHKLMMTSATYMQSVLPNVTSERVDPANEYFGRRTPQRLEAEVLRDSMLAVGGLLDQTLFGPGTLDPNQKRRSIYFTVKRSQLVPMMQLFDAPEPLVSMGSRPETTIAPQALLFLNSSQVRECAMALGGMLPAGDLKRMVNYGFQTTIGRPPSEEELRDSVEFLNRQTASYRETSAENAPKLAFTDFAQTLLGLNEFIYVE